MVKSREDMYADVNTLMENIRKTNRKVSFNLEDVEDYKVNPDAKPGDLDAKTPWRIKDLYPKIDDYKLIPTKLYTSPEVMEEEWENLWTKTWLLAGRVQDVKEVGDWFKFDIGRESIVIVRSSKDKISAFYNACTHRGNQLVWEDCGKGTKSFVCNYHSWMFTLEGKNARVTDRETFDEAVLCDGIDLLNVHTHVWAGFVFIHMGEEPIPFEEYIGEDLLKFMNVYNFEDMHIVNEVEFTLPANWKVSSDAFQEVYHLHQTHPQALLASDETKVQMDFFKNGHNRIIQKKGAVSPRQAKNFSDTVNEALRYYLEEAGIDPETYDGDPTDIREVSIKAKREKMPYGIDYSKLADCQLADTINVTFFPNVTFTVWSEGLFIQRFRPHPTDPNQSVYDAISIVPKIKEGVTRPFYYQSVMDVFAADDISGETRPEKKYTTFENPQCSFFIEQDFVQIAANHRGLKSRGVRGVIRLSEQERRIQQFYNEHDLYLKGEKFKPAVSKETIKK
ncbi:aromatic ring-hydroxylating dioxygenase subunit alpha [Bacillus sp. B15-48]|uniref:aromatic ring-hydroxylating oxygenase subunit alpha n=1 Tax=Bacillus sp. B15-48 TaxID=1548601 RepID=UPI00193FD7F6|nr:aromatic ring-hydroxylating dioxygenase subunit alpha [Bacillus sp. B15-48]MBM4763327.1 Rieske 2Fe-2S domain-containing protein [Bacillus sp. B15-48]